MTDWEHDRLRNLLKAPAGKRTNGQRRWADYPRDMHRARVTRRLFDQARSDDPWNWAALQRFFYGHGGLAIGATGAILFVILIAKGWW